MAEESRSTFDFSDQFGSDPIVRRYRPTDLVDIRGAEAGAREAAATRELAEANLSKVQAELTAQLAPMKTGVEMITTMSNLVKQRTALQEDVAIKRGATAISEGLNNPDLDLKALGQLVSGSNAIGLRDEETGVRARSIMLDKFTQSTDAASSPYEVDVAFSSIPAALAAEPGFQTARTSALAQAALRQGVRQSFASAPSLGEVPVTAAGGVDVPGAQLSIAAEAGAQERRKEARENLRFVQTEIQSLERKAEGIGELTPNEQLELDTLRGDARILLREVLQRDVSEGSQSTEPAEPAAPAGDVIASILPPGAVAAPDQAAAASAAATGGATSTPSPTATPQQEPEKVPNTRREFATGAMAETMDTLDQLKAERDRLYKAGYAYSGSKEYRELGEQIREKTRELTKLRADRGEEIRQEMDKIGPFSSGENRERYMRLQQELRLITGV